jgi:transcriptional regulator with XRE-family HTH domain
MAHVKYNRIKVVLAEKGKKNIALAESVNVKPQTVSNWCTNAKQPSVKQLFAIAKVLGVEAKDLLVSVQDV